MIFKDYYKILGLENNKVNIEQIKVAYREQAKKYHPDINVGDTIAEERFKDINEAYKILLDPMAKRKYDRSWNNHIAKKVKKEQSSKRSKLSFKEEFMNIFFGQANAKESRIASKSKDNKKPIKGENVETKIDISIEEAFYGSEKRLALKTVDQKLKNFTIQIPAGIRSGEKIRMLGQGKPGKNKGKNGDLLIKVDIIDSDIYRLSGYDLYTDLYIAPWEAVLGGKVEINTIDETLSVIVPKGVDTDSVIKIKNKGYKDGKGGRGSLIAQVKIVVQKELTKEEKEVYEKLKDLSKFNPRQGR